MCLVWHVTAIIAGPGKIKIIFKNGKFVKGASVWRVIYTAARAKWEG